MRCIRCDREAVDPVPAPMWPLLPVWECRVCPPVVVVEPVAPPPAPEPTRLQAVTPIVPPPPPAPKKKRGLFRRSR